jgi:hypothetical protein
MAIVQVPQRNRQKRRFSIVRKAEKITLYWPKGFLFWRPKAVYAEGRMLGGKRSGKWIYWYKNGEKQLEGEYVGSKKTGTWVKWNENGTSITEGEFLYGKMHGKWTDWHGNGQKALESHWVMGKRDGTWKYWSVEGTLEKTVSYDQNSENDKGYSIHTDLEIKQRIREIQKRNLHGTWENLVGKSAANLVNPWHIGCWVLIFVPLFGLVKSKTPWRSLAIAAVLAFLITSILAWAFDTGKSKQ